MALDLQKSADLLREINCASVSAIAAKKNLRDRFSQLENQHLHLAALTRKAANQLSHGFCTDEMGIRARSGSLIQTKPIGYSQELLYQDFVARLRDSPQYLACTLVSNNFDSNSSPISLESLVHGISFDLFPPAGGNSESTRFFTFIQTASILIFASIAKSLHESIHASPFFDPASPSSSISSASLSQPFDFSPNLSSSDSRGSSESSFFSSISSSNSSSSSSIVWDPSISAEIITSRLMQHRLMSLLLKGLLARDGEQYLSWLLNEIVVDLIINETQEFDFATLATSESNSSVFTFDSSSVSNPAMSPSSLASPPSTSSAVDSLLRWCHRILERLVSSIDHAPMSIRQIAFWLLKLAHQHRALSALTSSFTGFETFDSPSIVHNVLSELLFFPFLFHGLLHPEVVGICDHYAVTPAARSNLETIVQVMWKLVSSSKFSASQIHFEKMNSFLESWRPRILAFYLALVSNIFEPPSYSLCLESSTQSSTSEAGALKFSPICLQFDNLFALHQLSVNFASAFSSSKIDTKTCQNDLLFGCTCLPCQTTFNVATSVLHRLESSCSYLNQHLHISPAFYACPCKFSGSSSCDSDDGQLPPCPKQFDCLHSFLSRFDQTAASRLLSLISFQFSIAFSPLLNQLGVLNLKSFSASSLQTYSIILRRRPSIISDHVADEKVEDESDFRYAVQLLQQDDIFSSQHVLSEPSFKLLSTCVGLLTRLVRQLYSNSNCQFGSSSVIDPASSESLIDYLRSQGHRRLQLGHSNSSQSSAIYSAWAMLDISSVTTSSSSPNSSSLPMRSRSSSFSLSTTSLDICAPSPISNSASSFSSILAPSTLDVGFLLQRPSKEHGVDHAKSVEVFDGAMLCFELARQLEMLPSEWKLSNFSMFLKLAMSIWSTKLKQLQSNDCVSLCAHMFHHLDASQHLVHFLQASAQKKLWNHELRTRIQRLFSISGQSSSSSPAKSQFVGVSLRDHLARTNTLLLNEFARVHPQAIELLSSPSSDRQLTQALLSCDGPSRPDIDEFVCAKCWMRATRLRIAFQSFLQSNCFGDIGTVSQRPAPPQQPPPPPPPSIRKDEDFLTMFMNAINDEPVKPQSAPRQSSLASLPNSSSHSAAAPQLSSESIAKITDAILLQGVVFPPTSHSSSGVHSLSRHPLLITCLREDDAFSLRLTELMSVCSSLDDFHRLIWVGSENFFASIQAEKDLVSPTAVLSASTPQTLKVQDRRLRVPPAPLISEVALDNACQELARMSLFRSPRRKLGVLLQIRALLLAALSMHPTASAENYQTTVCYVLARSNPFAFLSQMTFIRLYIPDSHHTKVYSDFCIAVKCLLKLEPPRVDYGLSAHLNATAVALENNLLRQIIAEDEFKHQDSQTNSVDCLGSESSSTLLTQSVITGLQEMGFPQVEIDLAVKSLMPHLVSANSSSEDALQRSSEFLANMHTLEDEGFHRTQVVQALLHINRIGSDVANARVLLKARVQAQREKLDASSHVSLSLM